MNPWGGNLNQKLKFFVSVSPLASGTHDNTVTMSGAGSDPVSDVDAMSIGTEERTFGFDPQSLIADTYAEHRPLPRLQRQAGGHPYELRTDFDFNHLFDFSPPEDGTKPFTKPIGRVRTVQVILPRGIIGNPESTPKCSGDDFLDAGRAGFEAAGCPADTQIGQLGVQLADQWVGGGWGLVHGFPKIAVYNLVPPKGVAADFGYKAGALFIGHIYQTLDSSRDYAIKSTAPYIPDIIPVRNVRLTLWGVPGDPSHDPVRAFPQVEGPDHKPLPGPEFGAHVDPPYRPLLNMPMDCGVDNGPFLYSADSWNNPDEFTDPAARHHRRRQRHRLRRRAGPVPPGDQPAADRSLRGRADRPRRPSRSRAEGPVRPEPGSAVSRKRTAARHRHAADEESRHHLPGRDDDLDLGGAGPRRVLLVAARAGDEQTGDLPGQLAVRAAHPAHADPAARRTDARLHLHREKGRQPVQQLPLDVLRDRGTRTRPADQDPRQDRPRSR